jgi:Ca-activated chloride channel homolog
MKDMINNSVQFSYALNKPFLPLAGAEKVYLLLECRGDGNDTASRAPINASLVLDRSGSMAGAPLQFSKQACNFVVNQMDASDTLSLVAFDNEVDTIFAPQAVRLKDKLKRQIETIHARGTTNLSGGLLQGIQFVLQGKRDGTVNRVILLSDGHANEGVTDRNRLGAIANEFRTAGVTITTMGVGDGFDEELMELIAENGGGNFYYIQQADNIPELFKQELQGMLQIVAQNLQLQLTPSEGVRITGVYGYRSTQTEHYHNVLLSDIYHNEEKSILVELAISPNSSGEHTLLNAEWTYVDITQGAALNTAKLEIRGHFTNNLDLLSQPADPKVEKQQHITESANIIEHAIMAFDAGDIEHGKDLLQQQADKMHAFAMLRKDEEISKESQTLYQQLENFAYDAQKRKELHAQKYRTMKRKKMD